ncbi:MAG: M23 family metallopeptidase [Myxococcota bacterium]|jgi:murein DD-endopeptidase MepM/ murein hydrolase activator NlpD|nr:M23 family metallopeptidase [Myxococcota bacterium]
MTRSAFGGVVLLLMAAAVAAVFFTRCEGTPPVVGVAGPIALGAAARDVAVEITDAGAGVRSFEAAVVHAGGEIPLAGRDFGGSVIPFLGASAKQQSAPLSIDAKALGLAQGEAKLRVSARDLSWRDWTRGNQTVVEVPLSIDFRPPMLSLAPGIKYAKRAGSVLFVYDVSDDTEVHGVEVGDRFYPGLPVAGEGVPASRRFVLFPLSQELPADVKIRIVAIDGAGNRAERTPQINIKDRAYPEEKIVLPERFLSEKVPDLAGATGVAFSGDPVATFQEINTRIRQENEAKIREVTAESANEPYFSGAFQQMKDSQVRSSFAERRSYFVADAKVSESIHYGYDLASLAGAPIQASNRGKVVFAEELGIYGGCVIIDHGLGLHTLYGHLSSISAQVGDVVEQGQEIGRSGQTGLAGGDHLHFAILLRGVYVDPVEWWDAKWVREHVESLLAAAKQ